MPKLKGKNYELVFKVSGLGFLFSDMLLDGFDFFDPLFASNSKKDFFQYYRNEKIQKALDYGVNWLSKPHGFSDYYAEFKKYYSKNVKVLDQILSEKSLNPASTKIFFAILSKIFSYDTKLDNKFMDKAYILSAENSILKNNIKHLEKFKNESRLWINRTFLDEDNQFSSFVEKISKQFSLDKADIENYKINELIAAFKGFRLNSKELQKRKYAYAIYSLSSKKYYISGKEAEDLIKSFNSKNKISKEIKGISANNGMATGKARVINVDYGDQKKMHKKMAAMKKGEILIAEFTAPELMPACKKAKAIVTDIGGLLSHAAIISRELNIPCVVGTRNASQAFKDGDIVEVAATKGIVKKLK